MDSNHRRRKPADLQSAPVGHLGNLPAEADARNASFKRSANFLGQNERAFSQSRRSLVNSTPVLSLSKCSIRSAASSRTLSRTCAASAKSPRTMSAIACAKCAWRCWRPMSISRSPAISSSGSKRKPLGQEVIQSIQPGQQIIKIIHDELVDLLGSTNCRSATQRQSRAAS